MCLFPRHEKSLRRLPALTGRVSPAAQPCDTGRADAPLPWMRLGPRSNGGARTPSNWGETTLRWQALPYATNDTDGLDWTGLVCSQLR